MNGAAVETIGAIVDWPSLVDVWQVVGAWLAIVVVVLIVRSGMD